MAFNLPKLKNPFKDDEPAVQDNQIRTTQATLVNPVQPPTTQQNVVQGGAPDLPTTQETALDIPGFGNLAGFVQTDPNGNITGLTTAGINQLQNMGLDAQDIAGKVKGRGVQDLGEILRGGAQQLQGIQAPVVSGLQALGAGVQSQVQQDIQSGDYDAAVQRYLDDPFAFYGDFLDNMPPEMQDYMTQLATGQTAATRALQAQNAAALTSGITNMMNNISASAASAGITGGELSRLYSRGIAEAGRMMGDFALENIIRAEQTQQNAFQNFLDAFRLSSSEQTQWMNTKLMYEELRITHNQYKMQLYADDSVAAQIYDLIDNGLPVTQEQIDYIRTNELKSQTQGDLMADISWYVDELGFSMDDLKITQVADPITGEPLFNLAGEPVWEVNLNSSITVDPVTGLATLNVPTAGQDEVPPEDLNLTVTIGGIIESVDENTASPTGFISGNSGLPVSVVDGVASPLDFDQYISMTDGAPDAEIINSYLKAGDKSALSNFVDTDPTISHFVDELNNATTAGLVSISLGRLENYIVSYQRNNNLPSSFVSDIKKIIQPRLSGAAGLVH